MSTRKQKKPDKNKKHTEGASVAVTPDFADYLALAPGFLMIAMLFLVLILDIAVPGMAEKQYEDFPGIFTAFDYASVAAGLLYVVISMMRKDIRTEKTDIFFAAFMLLIIASTAVNGFNEYTIDGVPYRYIGILNMAAFFLIYMCVTRSIKRESFGNVVLIGYLAAADIIGLTALYDRYIGTVPAFQEKKELSAIFFNGNHYGYFLLMAVLIALGYFLFGDRRQAAAGAVSAGLNLALLVINHSLGSMIAVIIVLIGTAILIAVKDRSYWKKTVILLAVMTAAFIAAFVLSPDVRKEFTGFIADLAAIAGGNAKGSAGHNRWKLWALTLQYIAKKPMLGYGCEGISFMLYEAMAISNPHSEVLTYAAYYGIPAAILYATGVVSVLLVSISRIKTNKATQKAACMAAAGYLLSSFTGVGMFYTLPFFFIFLGLSLKR